MKVKTKTQKKETKKERKHKRVVDSHQHIIKRYRKAVCGVHVPYEHMIYHPKDGDSMTHMIHMRVCIMCIKLTDWMYNYTV